MLTAGAFINAMGEIATWRSRQLGARDPETGWPAVTWSDSSINVMVKFLGQTVRDTPIGRVTGLRIRLYTATTLEMKDRVVYNGVTYEVEDEVFDHVLLTQSGYKHYTCIKVDT